VDRRVGDASSGLYDYQPCGFRLQGEGRKRTMNFLRRWRHGSERNQERLLVRLWTINTLDVDDNPQTSKLAFAASAELKSSLKYLSGSEIESTIHRTITETAYQHRFMRNLKKQIIHGRPER
jgi:hypothetical protein